MCSFDNERAWDLVKPRWINTSGNFCSFPDGSRPGSFACPPSPDELSYWSVFRSTGVAQDMGVSIIARLCLFLPSIRGIIGSLFSVSRNESSLIEKAEFGAGQSKMGWLFCA